MSDKIGKNLPIGKQQVPARQGEKGPDNSSALLTNHYCFPVEQCPALSGTLPQKRVSPGKDPVFYEI